MISRHQSTSVRAALADTPAILIVGPRQVGKSTLATAEGATAGVRTTVSLDLVSGRAGASADPEGFIRKLDLPAVIDEVQRVPELLYPVKQLVDERRLTGERAHGLFLLTGSASIWDTLEAPESLAGRVERVRLRPFSQGEIAGRRERFIDHLFADDFPGVEEPHPGREAIAQSVMSGGFPEVQGRDEDRAERWFSEYLARVLERDIRDLANVRRPEDMHRLLRMCAARTAGLINVEGMLADLGMGKSTGRRYYELLQRTYLIEEIPAWGTNLARAAVRRPKLVVADSGLAAHLTGYSAAKFITEPDGRPGPGALFETFVISELLKARDWASGRPSAFHWRDASGREVDLIFERRDGQIIAIECKLGSTATEADFRHLAFLRDQLGDRFAGGAVVYTGAATVPFGDRLRAVPVSSLWAG